MHKIFTYIFMGWNENKFAVSTKTSSLMILEHIRMENLTKLIT